MQTVASLKINQMATILSLNNPNKVKYRLMELGFVKGAKVKVLAISSLKKTYLLEIQGCVIALRSSILKEILICKN